MNVPDYFTIGQRQQLERIAAYVAVHAPYQLPLYRAARDGLINLVHPERGGRIPKHLLEDNRRPLIVVIGDDDHASTGPEGWACAKPVRNWARAGIIHAAGGEAKHYQLAVNTALLVHRFILIETSSIFQDQWAHFIKSKMPTLIIRTPAERPHPKLPSAREVN